MGRATKKQTVVEEVTFNQVLGDALCELRLKADLSQEALAEQAGVGQSTISRIESGVAWPTVDGLRRIANALDTSAWVILKQAELRWERL